MTREAFDEHPDLVDVVFQILGDEELQKLVFNAKEVVIGLNELLGRSVSLGDSRCGLLVLYTPV